MRTLSDTRDGLSLRQIALQVGLPRSTVQRIVHALAAEGLVTSPSPTGGIRLGREVQRLAARLNGDTPALLRPYLEALSETTGETIDLAVLCEDHIEFVDQVVGAQRLRAVSAVGERFPLHTTASGKACLAQLADTDLASQVARIGQANAKPGQWREAFFSEIRTVRGCGLAFDEEEHTAGISAVGTGLRDRVGDVYAISIPAPSQRFGKKRDRFAKHLLDTIKEVRAII